MAQAADAVRTRTLIVTGASGHVGRRVLELLLDKQLSDTHIVATTRTPEKLAELARRGVIVRKADFSDHSSLDSAFKGGDRLLLISTNDIFVPGQRAAQQVSAVKAAVAAGVKHIVYISVINGASAKRTLPLMQDHVVTEEEIAAHAGIDFTIIRAGYWFENLLHSLPGAASSGTYASATGNGRVAFVTREETAIVAAAELASDRSGRSTVTVTGPAALTFAEVLQEASNALGKHITYIPVTKEAKVKTLVGFNVAPPIAELFVSFDVAISESHWSQVSPPHPAVPKRTTLAEWLAQSRAVITGEQK